MSAPLTNNSQGLLILFHNCYSLLVQKTTETKHQDMLITPTATNDESQRELSTLPDWIEVDRLAPMPHICTFLDK